MTTQRRRQIGGYFWRRILISLDRGLGDIRTYPPGSHPGIVVLRLTDQSAATRRR